MDFGRRSFPLSSFNPIRQKQLAISQQNVQSANVTRPVRQVNGGSADSQINTLKQCISAYLDAIQMVCRAGTWLSETFSYLLNESPSGPTALEMKSKFTKMLQLSNSTTLQAKNDLSTILLELSLPDVNGNNRAQAIEDCRNNNAKVLERCIHCLSEVHNSFFKFELNINVDVKSNNPSRQNENKDKKTESKIPDVQRPIMIYAAEWEKITDTSCNTKSWEALKQQNKCLRKYNGLTDMEIQNLLKHGTVSDLYLAKLNQRIDTALRNYEVGLRGIPNEFTVVFGGFHSDPNKAKAALLGCCSQMEIEQGTQRLPVSQFLSCELPRMAVTINKKDFCTDTKNLSENVNQKKKAVRQLLQSTNQKLSISETDDLSSEILGDVCPARWRTHVKATLQLLYGNSGLIIMDTLSGETNTKRNAVISLKDNFIVVSVTSTWCLKEDPGTMSLLQRNLDPEKTLATVHVRYVSVFYNKALATKRFEPGIFVETFVRTGSQNRRRASQTLRATQTLSGIPLTPISTFWLTNQSISKDSPVLSTRLVLNSQSAEATDENRNKILSVKSKVSKSDETEGKSERKRKKKLVVEIKEGDTSSDDDKSSDNDDSVKDVIHMLSGSTRTSSRRRHIVLTEKKTEPDTDELSKATEDILDSSELDSNKDHDAEFKISKPEISQKLSGSPEQNHLNPDPPRSQTLPYFETSQPTAQSPMPQMPSFQHMKAQTLPGVIGRIPQDSTEDLVKSSSNTLPMHARDMLWASQFAQVNPQQMAMNLGAHGMNPHSFNNQGIPNAARFGSPYFSPTPSTSPFSGVSPSISPRPNFNMPQNSPSNNRYNTWSNPKDFSILVNANQSTTDGSDNGVKEILQGMKNMSTSPGMLSQARMNGNAGFHSQHNFIHGNEQMHDKMMNPQQNSNNNNLSTAPGMTLNTIRNSRSLPHPGLHHFGDNMSRSLTVPDEGKQQNYRPEMSHSPFQGLFQMAENKIGDARNTGNGSNLGTSRSQENFGVIGSPVIGRQRKNDPEVSLQQQQQQQQPNSNTWPFLPGLGNQEADLGTGDQDYDKYVANITRNAIRRQIQNPPNQPFDPADIAAWNNGILWENQSLEPVPPESSIFRNNGGPASEAGNPTTDRSVGVPGSDLVNQGTDASRTGTWPPWQLWSPVNNNSGIWNWGNEAPITDVGDTMNG